MTYHLIGIPIGKLSYFPVGIVNDTQCSSSVIALNFLMQKNIYMIINKYILILQI